MHTSVSQMGSSDLYSQPMSAHIAQHQVKQLVQVDSAICIPLLLRMPRDFSASAVGQAMEDLLLDRQAYSFPVTQGTDPWTHLAGIAQDKTENEEQDSLAVRPFKMR